MIRAQVGEDVIFHYGNRMLPRLEKVVRITPSGQIVIEGFYNRFYGDTGKEVGGIRSSTVHIEDVTPESIQDMNAKIERILDERYIERLRIAFQQHIQAMTVEQFEELAMSLDISFPSREDIAKEAH